MKNENQIGLITVLAIFITGSFLFGGQAPVYLGTAGNFVILSKTGISCVPPSVINGNIGASPIAASAITGFGMLLDASGQFSKSGQVNGKVYAANYFGPTPSMLTMAVNDMQTAYVDAALRQNPDYAELGDGNISGKTLSPGLYKWSTGISINSDITLKGGPGDVWIFQSIGDISMADGIKVRMTGGAQAKNVFWQAVSCIMGKASHIEGIVLSATTIHLAAGASVNGRLLAQTAVTLQMNTITQPE